ncbi:DDE_3 domain-containing protein [Trichonephila clavipes]|nr:DDE_3 domain-containing protein [Trichonephila clavipes]
MSDFSDFQRGKIVEARLAGHGCGSVMIWAAISWFSARPIVTPKGKITREKYTEVLVNQINPMLQTLFSAEDGIFQDDNVPIHAAGLVQS